jgi:hypothetical protein
MPDRIRPHLTYANVMVTVLLFIVLGGSVYAAGKIGSGDIAKDAVRSKHIKKNAVNNKDLAASALSCPAGMRRLQTLCWERNPNAARENLLARYACANKGLELPSSVEMLRIAHSGAYPGDDVEKWTSDSFENSSGFQVARSVSKDVGLSVLDQPAGNEYGFHCVREATP